MKTPEIQEVLKENRRRVKEMFAPYDPVKGVNTVANLQKFYLDNSGNSIYLPDEVLNDYFMQEVMAYSSLLDYCKYNKLEGYFQQILNDITNLRFKYDFEFWAATCVTITDKDSKEIPFILNRPQRRLLSRYEKMRRNHQPIREIIVKARQWGGSTLTQIYIAWLQIWHDANRHSRIIAKDQGQARHIRGMFTALALKHPKDIKHIELVPYEGSQNEKMIKGRGNIVGVGSVKEPDSGRSFTTHYVHMSEVGLWESTEKRSGGSLAQAIRASVPRKPYTMIVMESTAKGTGTFFHKEYQKAQEGGKGYDSIFVPWFEIEEYRLPIEDYFAFIENMGEYDWFLWELGATLESINWYNDFKDRENYSDLDMNSEYPSTADEAFQSTGSRVIPKPYVKRHEKEVMEPSFVGELHAMGQKGKDALTDIEFHNNPKGRLQVWVKPDKTEKVTNRYGIFMDIGGKTSVADYSVISVFDRYMLMENGPIERVAVWRGHLDQDLVAWRAAQIAAWYNNGLLAVEVNSLKNKDKEGNHSMTVLDEIAEFYDNLFFRNDPEKVKEQFTRYGFHTNEQSKSMIINRYVAALRDYELIERYDEALKECDWFEVKDNGTMGAVDGQHDDVLITTAGATWLCLSYMPPPQIIKPTTDKHKSKKKPNTYADF